MLHEHVYVYISIFIMWVYNIIITDLYLNLYRLSPWSGWTGFLPSKLLIEEDTLEFDWRKGPKSYPEKNVLFAADFPEMHWQSDPRPLVAGTDTSWIFTSIIIVCTQLNGSKYSNMNSSI